VKIDRHVIPLTDLPPLGNKRFAIPWDATGKKWVRFAIWDSAGNGAFVQPVWVDGPRPSFRRGEAKTFAGPERNSDRDAIEERA
jgi:hypothetical protein